MRLAGDALLPAGAAALRRRGAALVALVVAACLVADPVTVMGSVGAGLVPARDGMSAIHNDSDRHFGPAQGRPLQSAFASQALAPRPLEPGSLAPTELARRNRSIERLTRAMPWLRVFGFYPRIDPSAIPCQGAPAAELINALELENAAVIMPPAQDPATTLTTYRIRIPRRWTPWRPPRGLQLLKNELGPTREFDLLFEPDGSLSGIIPVLRGPLRSMSYQRRPSYFDLTAYGLRVPSPDDPDLEGRWERLGSERGVKQRHLRDALGRYGYGRRLDRLGHDPDGVPHASYVVAEIVTEVGVPRFVPFEPEDWLVPAKRKHLIQALKARPQNPRAIIPVFPTVYPPAHEHNRPVDVLYLQSVWETAVSLRGTPDARILVVGPGTGLDVWLAWVASGGAALYAVGINPLEVANLRALARMAGFAVHTAVHDNILDRFGRCIFGATTFDRVYTNAPYYVEGPRSVILRLLMRIFIDWKRPMEAYWDGDRGGFMRGFSRGLARVLKPVDNAFAITWYLRNHPALYELMKSAGLDCRAVADDEDVAIYQVRRTPKAEAGRRVRRQPPTAQQERQAA